MKNKPLFDPTWNYIPRTMLLYVLPLSLMSFLFYNDLVGFTRDFLIPLSFAFIVPPINIRKKCWSLKDFQSRDHFVFTMPFIFSGFWMLSLQCAPYLWMAVPCFMGLFFLFDFLLLKYELLKFYGQSVEKLKKGFFGKFLTIAIVWWGYVSIALFLVHKYGTDTWFSMAVCLVFLALPIEMLFLLMEHALAKPERLKNIKKVAVIGAGFSGVYATKWLSENNMEVECFEKNDSIGGVWRLSEEKKERGTFFKNTRTTSSKHFMHAMDFRAKDEVPDFPHHWQYLEFLENYADHFHVREKIALSAEVKNVEKRGDKWYLSLLHQGEEKVQTYDAVVVCTGSQGIPTTNVKNDPLYSRFKGKIIHASEYKDHSQIGDDEKLLIIGTGEGSADIVTECALKNRNISWAVNGGQWFAESNVGLYPADHFVGVGIRQLLGKFLNCEHLIRRFTQAGINVFWGLGGHGIPEWIPNSPYLHQLLNNSRDGISEIHKGRVTPKRAISEINGNKVRFEGEEEAMEFDTIILATDLKPHWPFLKEAPSQLFKLVFDPQDLTLSFVGLAQPVIGSVTSLAEIQARWVATVLSGQIALRCAGVRESIIYEELKDKEKRFKDSSDLKVLADQVDYSNELAVFMGIHVPWWRLLFLNPRAFWLMLWSPWTAFQFQLSSKDKEAREKALQNIREVMPDCRHPVNGFATLILFALFAVIAFGGVLFYCLPPWQFCGIFAIALTVMAVYIRWRELAWARQAY